VFFDTLAPGTITQTVPVTGLGNDTLFGIELSPSNGLLYGVSPTRLYTINPASGAATPVGAQPFAQAIRGNEFGVDFDPFTGHLRVVSNADANVRIDPATGQIASFDADLTNDSIGGAFSGDVLAAAYDTGSTLFGIASVDGAGVLVRIGGPGGNPSANGGVVFRIQSLGQSILGNAVGFEVAGGTAFATWSVGTTAPSQRLFSINLAPTPGQPVATDLGQIGNGLVAIRGLTDAPPPSQVQFDPTPVVVNEADGTVTVTVVRTGDVSGAADVTVTATGGTATAGTDYTPVTQVVTFAPGQASTAATFTIVNDQIVEGNETIDLALVPPVNGVVIGQPATTTVTITDDDRVQVQLSAADYFATENGGSAAILVQRQGDLTFPTTVTVTAAAGTATAGADFTPVTQVINFAPGETQRAVLVPILDDTLIEGPETVLVTLTAQQPGVVVGAPASATLTIQDDDLASVRFEAATFSAAESAGAAAVRVVREGLLDFTAVVTVSAFAGSASAGSDFTPVTQVVTFAAGEAVATVLVPVVNDTAAEGPETVVLSLSNPQPGTVLGQPASAVLTIVDDDRAVYATGAGPGGGPHVRVFDSPTGNLVFEFLAYDRSFAGGVHVATADVTGDGIEDVITGPGESGGPHVKVFDGATRQLVREFLAYDAGFRGGVWVAGGDVDGDGRADIVTGAGRGGGPHVKVFSGATGALLREYMAYDPAFRGGVTVAAGDVNGDRRADLITGPGPGGGPHVRVLSGANLAVLAEFQAFDPAQRFGITVAAGDVDGNGFADVVVGNGSGGAQAAVGAASVFEQPIPLPGGRPQVKVYSLAPSFRTLAPPITTAPTLLAQFDAYAASDRFGVNVAVADAVLFGLGGLLVGPGKGGQTPARVLVMNDGPLQELRSFLPYGPGLLGGVFVG
jgi:hypothetical protein